MSADQVNTVINAPEHHLRALVKVLLTGQDDGLRRNVLDAYSSVLRLEQESQTGAKRKADFGDDGPANAGMVDDLHNCARCGVSFLRSKVSGGECQYHPGELLFDEESGVWQEWEYSEMDMDTMESRRDFPEGFKFSCCGGDGEAKACKSGDHIARKKP